MRSRRDIEALQERIESYLTEDDNSDMNITDIDYLEFAIEILDWVFEIENEILDKVFKYYE